MLPESTQINPVSVEFTRSVRYEKATAFLNGKSVGLFVFRITTPKPGVVHLFANGTEVNSSFQKHGIGTLLWEATLNKYKPTHITVHTESQGGFNLVDKMRRCYPEIDWEHW